MQADEIKAHLDLAHPQVLMQAALALAQRETLPRRVMGAIALDQCQVPTERGNARPRGEVLALIHSDTDIDTEALTALERAEEVAYSIDDIEDGLWEFTEAILQCGLAPQEPEKAAHQIKWLKALLEKSDAAVEPARDALSLFLEGKSLPDRDFDPPHPRGVFSVKGARALLDPVGAFLKIGQQQEFTGRKVPGAAVGQIFSVGFDGLRLGVGPIHGMRDFLQFCRGSLAVRLLARGTLRDLRAAGEDQVRLLADLLLMALLTPNHLQGAWEISAPEAERAALALRARWILDFRAHAALALALLEGENEIEGVRPVMKRAVGAPLTMRQVAGILQPPWPGLLNLRSRLADSGREAFVGAAVAGLAPALRERWDENAPLHPEFHQALLAITGSLFEGEATVSHLVGAGEPDAQALSALITDAF
jgi:hypothetical protein